MTEDLGHFLFSHFIALYRGFTFLTFDRLLVFERVLEQDDEQVDMAKHADVREGKEVFVHGQDLAYLVKRFL